MDPVAITASTTGTSTTPSTDADKTGKTDKTAADGFAARLAEARKDLKDGEKLERINGHQFARIKGGDRDELCVNLSGNARSGETFHLIMRNGHTFHAYGTGKDRVVVEVAGHEAAAKKDAAETGGTKSKS